MNGQCSETAGRYVDCSWSPPSKFSIVHVLMQDICRGMNRILIFYSTLLSERTPLQNASRLEFKDIRCTVHP
jgi:hypothetical protein